MNDHETAAADISGARISHGQRKAGGDRGIDRITALPQDIGANLCADFLLRHHHAVFREHGMSGVGGKGYVFAALLLRSCGQVGRNQQGDCRKQTSPFGRERNHQTFPKPVKAGPN
jgi:hypothetical protein